MDRPRRDERPHEVGDGLVEEWCFDFAAADGQLGGWVRFVRRGGRHWYQALFTGPHRQLLAVLDDEVPHRNDPMEIRTTGLWADHICETPFDHWTLGLEAFALGVDDPLELYGAQRGDRVPLGLDVEWETDGPVHDWSDGVSTGAGAGPMSGSPGVDGYGMACRVHGEVLVGDEVIDLDAVGHRRHRWGAIDWAASDGWSLTAALDGGEHLVVRASADGVSVLLDGHGEITTPPASARLRLDADGLPLGATVQAGDRSLTVEALAPTPVTVGGIRRPRALCRVRRPDGGIGVGWLETGPVTGGRLAS